jgi:hypothetical protein
MELIPAYGRDYASKKPIIEDWNKCFDFQDSSLPSRGYINKTDAENEGIKSVYVRYSKMRKIAHIRKNSKGEWK